MSESGFPGSHIAIIDPKTGRSTNAFWRLLELLWRRTGAFDDILADLDAADADLGALINSLEASTEDYGRGIARLDALRAGAGDPDEPLQAFDVEMENIFRIMAGTDTEKEDYSLAVFDEGNRLTGRVSGLNFVGAGVAATVSGSVVTVTISGGSGGGGSVSSVFGRTGAVVAAASDYDADQVDYDNSSSGLAATDVQDAIDEVNSKIGWVLIDQETITTSPASVSFINLGDYDEIVVIGRNITASNATQKVVQFSSNNGSTWDQTGANYPIVSNGGDESTPTPGGFFPQGDLQTTATTFIAPITNWNKAEIKWLDRQSRGNWQLYVNAVALDALRVVPITGGALSGTLTGGTIYVFGKKTT